MPSIGQNLKHFTGNVDFSILVKNKQTNSHANNIHMQDHQPEVIYVQMRHLRVNIIYVNVKFYLLIYLELKVLIHINTIILHIHMHVACTHNHIAWC